MSVVSTTEPTSTPHASADRTAQREKVFSLLGSLMSTLQDFWNEALAAGIDGKIKLQAAELQELEDARQRGVDKRVCSGDRQAGPHTGAGAA